MRTAAHDLLRALPHRARLLLVLSLGLALAATVGAPAAWPVPLEGVLAVAAWCSALAAVRSVVRARTIDEVELARLREVATRRADQVSVLSHEIRTPLAVVGGSTELLLEGLPGPLTDRQRTFLTTISRNVTHVHSLAENLLTQARIEAGMFDVHLERVDLRAVLRAVVAELRQVHHPVRIVLDAPGPPTRVVVDPQLVTQAVVNLVANAVRYSPDSRSVTVRVTRSEGDVVLAISDDGRGMSRADRDRLFHRFASGEPLGDGTGIGLYITHHIVDLHGGRIYVDSLPDRGTTMTLTLPARTTERAGEGDRAVV